MSSTDWSQLVVGNLNDTEAAHSFFFPNSHKRKTAGTIADWFHVITCFMQSIAVGLSYSQGHPWFNVYYTERKLENKKRGRPGNEARFNVQRLLVAHASPENKLVSFTVSIF